MEAQKLIIDWTQMPTYNTIMSVSAGSGLISLVSFARDLNSQKNTNLDAWAISFGVPGFILVTTGLHMSLTWPMAKYFPFDNIIFGETSLGFGVLLFALSLYLWFRAPKHVMSNNLADELSKLVSPLTPFIIGLGLGLIAIGAAGIRFKLFAAPHEEPISGLFADYPMFEASVISTLFASIGVGALLLPSALRGFSLHSPVSTRQLIVGWIWLIAGLFLLLFGALNFFTHIGLIVNTMK